MDYKDYDVSEDNVEEKTSTLTIKPAVVVNCEKLNVRVEPTKESDVVCVIDKGTEVTIIDDPDNEDWLWIYTKDNAEGYSMRNYLKFTDMEDA